MSEADHADPAVGGFAPPGRPAARGAGGGAAGRRFRFSELRLQATLWDGVVLVRAWGRLGTPGRSRVWEYPDREAAGPEVPREVHRRLGRGYRLVGAG